MSCLVRFKWNSLSLQQNLSLLQGARLLAGWVVGQPWCHTPSSVSIRRAGRAELGEELAATHHRGLPLGRFYKGPGGNPAKMWTPKASLTVRNPTLQHFYQLLILQLKSPTARRAWASEELGAALMVTSVAATQYEDETTRGHLTAWS